MGQFEELQRSILVEGGGWEHVQTLQRTDPRAWTLQTANRSSFLKRVRELTPRIDQVVSELIDNFIEKGSATSMMVRCECLGS